MTEQSRRQRRGTERTEIVIENTEMVGNRQECHGKAGERWRRSEKIRYMTIGLGMSLAESCWGKGIYFLLVYDQIHQPILV